MNTKFFKSANLLFCLPLPFQQCRQLSPSPTITDHEKKKKQTPSCQAEVTDRGLLSVPPMLQESSAQESSAAKKKTIKKGYERSL